jgi:DNA primase large subunit
VELDVRQAAKYPFLRDSGQLLKEMGVSLDSLVSSVAYERARFLGKERVLEAIENGKIEDHPMASEVDATLELLSYPIARIIVSSVADQLLVNRYAIAEAKKMDERLRKEEVPFIKSIASELGLQTVEEEGMMAVDFSDFLRCSASIRSKDWKLINQQVRDGRVVITKARLIRLVQQILADRTSSELPLPVNDTIIGAFSDDIAEISGMMEELRKAYESKGFGQISITRFPPCMNKLLTMMQAGENVPHTGRFALVAFLHTLGMNSEEVMALFSTAPDFNESKTLYQIQHITGEISGTEYTPPECSTMKSYGICFDPDKLCSADWMNHPLTYYKAKGRRRRSRK